MLKSIIYKTYYNVQLNVVFLISDKKIEWNNLKEVIQSCT